MITRADVPRLFEFDGSWRDIYVLGVTDTDWDAMLGLARSGVLGVMQFFLDDVPAAMPAHAETIARIANERASPRLELSLGGLVLNCRFFGDNQIELDYDPREMTDERLALLLDWLRTLGTKLRKDVLVTEENRQMAPLVLYKHDISRILVVSKIDKEEWEEWEPKE